jgi:cysteinyl-tRNA synthetase
MQIFNTLTKCKETFVSISPNKIKMYVCGQTVYDYCHLGHARKAIVFDMIRSWFIHSNYEVIFVENITDIDDKIINRALENNESIEQLTKRFTQYMLEDFAKLGIKLPTLQPKATEYIAEMVAIIDNLIKNGFAYKSDNGDIYYKVRKFANYGKLSGKTLNDLISGSRVVVNNNKQDPLDFVLWKRVTNANEPHWESIFGKGRPGWHIECSAMAHKLLGHHFDIHGGGQDLQFPHHENEIAQSEAYSSSKFANYWIHNGFLNINDEKMSKSLGNFFTLRDLLLKYDGEVIRLFMLKTHYRSPLNFSLAGLDDAKVALTKLYQTLNNFPLSQDVAIDWNNNYAVAVKTALDDDFNTPVAIGSIFELCNTINRTKNVGLSSLLKQLANILGLLTKPPLDFLQITSAIDSIGVEQIESYIEQRNAARITKNFILADQIRDQLLAAGIILEDKGNKTTWRKV